MLLLAAALFARHIVRRVTRSLAALSGPALALIAVWIGRARLTDNMPLAWDVA